MALDGEDRAGSPGREGSEDRRYYADDEFDLFDYIEVLIKRRWLILFGVVICVCTTFAYTWLREDIAYYVATATILPEGGYQDYLGTLTRGMEQVAPRQVYEDILRSPAIGKRVLSQQYSYRSPLHPEEVTGTLIDYFEAETIGRALRALEKCTTFETEKSGIIRISLKTRSPELSAQVANEYVHQLETYDAEMRTSQGREQLAFIEQRLAAVKTELDTAESSLVEFKRRNAGILGGVNAQDGRSSISHPEVWRELERLQRDVTVKSDLYSTLIRQYELAKITAKQERPVIQVLSYAEPPEVATRRSLRLMLIISAVVGGFVAVFLAFLLEYLEKVQQSGRAEVVLEELRKDRRRFLRLFGKSS